MPYSAAATRANACCCRRCTPIEQAGAWRTRSSRSWRVPRGLPQARWNGSGERSSSVADRSPARGSLRSLRTTARVSMQSECGLLSGAWNCSTILGSSFTRCSSLEGRRTSAYIMRTSSVQTGYRTPAYWSQRTRHTNASSRLFDRLACSTPMSSCASGDTRAEPEHFSCERSGFPCWFARLESQATSGSTAIRRPGRRSLMRRADRPARPTRAFGSNCPRRSVTRCDTRMIPMRPIAGLSRGSHRRDSSGSPEVHRARDAMLCSFVRAIPAPLRRWSGRGEQRALVWVCRRTWVSRR